MLVVLLGLSVFQIALAFARPYGEYAWGGYHAVLPLKLRIASALSVLLYGVFAIVIADAAGWIQVFSTTIPILLLALYSTFGIVMNGVSRSPKERAVMTPTATIMAACSWILYLQL